MNHTSFVRRHAVALALFSFTLALRLIALWQLSRTAYGEPVTSDMAFYAAWAQRIAAGELTDFHAFYGQPLYAYLLGAIFRLTGFEPLLIAGLQALIEALTSVLIFQIALAAFEQTPARARVIGALAGTGWALFVPAAAYSLLLIPASWLAAGWWFCIWWVLRRAGRSGILERFAVAAFVGAMAMISATMLFVVPLLFTRAGKVRIAAAAAVIGGVMLGTAPAWLHNTLVARDPVLLSAHSGLNFFIGNNPEANGYPRIPRELPSDQAALLRESINVAERAAGHPLKRSAVSAYWSAKARDYIASRPGDWLRLSATKLKNFWNAFVYDDVSSITALRDAGIILPGISFGLLAALALPGSLLALRLARARYVVGGVLLLLLALLPVFVNERYRMAAAPGLLILSAFFVVELWSAVSLAEWPRLAVYLALLMASAAFATMGHGEPALASLDDYKTARRHISARQYERAEFRLRRAFAPMVPAAQVSAGVANGFIEVAQEKLKTGDHAAALELVDEAIRINPHDPRHAALRDRIKSSDAAEQ